MTQVLEQIFKILLNLLSNKTSVRFILLSICVTLELSDLSLPVLALDDCLSITCQVIYQFCDNGLGRCVECTEYCNLKKPWLLQYCNDTCPDFYSILMMTTPPYPATTEAPTLITSQPPVTLQPKNDNLAVILIALWTDAEVLDSMLSKPIQETSQAAISSFPEQPD